ncbi:MAG: flavin reductase family protein [Kiloniellales bacterium]|nr:flavin reductase family protein [Kiloniellales bacterium]
MPVDAATFRAALGRFPTGVTVVTSTAPDGRRIGITVSSFASVSLEPPLVLFCLGTDNPDLADLQAAGRFAVNLLAEDQSDLSNTFAQVSNDKWRGIETNSGDGACPRLAGTLAVLDCRLADAFPGGDHVIVTGQVEAIELGSEDPPLVYFRGAYRRLAES